MKIAIITHQFDPRLRFRRMGWKLDNRKIYLIDDMILRLNRFGHRTFYCNPLTPFRPADAAILHVDSTVVGDDYAELSRRYPTCLNGGILDISKTRISDNIIGPDSDWTGRVIVKTDLNSHGGQEKMHARRSLAQSQGTRVADHAPPEDYRVYDRPDAVPADVWPDRSLVVEKFLPEVSSTGYSIRTWIFMGEYERCTRYESDDAIVKLDNARRIGPCDVPAEIRAARARLAIDYGKFDFVVHNGRPVLFDVNKTPGYSMAMEKFFVAAAVPMTRAYMRFTKKNLAQPTFREPFPQPVSPQ